CMNTALELVAPVSAPKTKCSVEQGSERFSVAASAVAVWTMASPASARAAVSRPDIEPSLEGRPPAESSYHLAAVTQTGRFGHESEAPRQHFHGTAFVS